MDKSINEIRKSFSSLNETSQFGLYYLSLSTFGKKTCCLFYVKDIIRNEHKPKYRYLHAKKNHLQLIILAEDFWGYAIWRLSYEIRKQNHK